MAGRADNPDALRPGLAGYPVNLLVRGRRVVVVGAGRIAARKIEPLLEAGAVVQVVSPQACAEVRGWAEAGRLVLTERSGQLLLNAYVTVPAGRPRHQRRNGWPESGTGGAAAPAVGGGDRT